MKGALSRYEGELKKAEDEKYQEARKYRSQLEDNRNYMHEIEKRKRERQENTRKILVEQMRER
jgi:hypothetical protein